MWLEIYCGWILILNSFFMQQFVNLDANELLYSKQLQFERTNDFKEQLFVFFHTSYIIFNYPRANLTTRKQPRMEIVYYFFFWVLTVEILFYLLLVAPSPRGFKGALTRMVTSSPKFFYVIQGLVILCVIAGLFFYDCIKTENQYHIQKHQLQSIGHMSSEMRRGWLSYTILKVQRNKYITFMLIYTSAALYLYIRLLNHLYKKRDDFQKNQERQSELKRLNSSTLKPIEKQSGKSYPSDEEKAKLLKKKQ